MLYGLIWILVRGVNLVCGFILMKRIIGIHMAVILLFDKQFGRLRGYAAHIPQKYAKSIKIHLCQICAPQRGVQSLPMGSVFEVWG